MGIIDRYLEKRGFVRRTDPVLKSAGFMELEASSSAGVQSDRIRIQDYGTFIDTYRRLPWMYAGLTALAIAATKPVLRFYRETKGKGGDTEQVEVEGEDINTLLEMPNPDWSYSELMQVSVINLALLGNQYWNLVGTRQKAPISKSNRPVEIWWVKPEQLTPYLKPDGSVNYYEFTSSSGQKKNVDPSEIIHFRMPTPASYHIGMGMMEPLIDTASLEIDAVEFQRNFLKNDGVPPMIFKHPGSPTAQQRKEFWTDWDQRHKGPKRAGRAGMIWGGMEPFVSAASTKDAQYVEQRKMNREEMLAALGVPPSVVGLLEYANYSNMEVQQKKFWDDSVQPILNVFADKITLRLAPLFDERIWAQFDYSGISVLQEDEQRKSTIAKTYFECGMMTPNQLRKRYLNADPYAGGDQYYAPMMMIAIGSDQPQQTSPAKQVGQGKAVAALELPSAKTSYWRNQDRKKVLWESYSKRVGAGERAMTPEVESFLRGQADEVFALASGHEHAANLSALGLFDVQKETEHYVSKFIPRYVAAFERAGNAGFQATKGMIWIPPEERRMKDEDGFHPTPEQLTTLKAQVEKMARFINETTSRVIKDELAKVEEGQKAWPTVAEVARMLRDKLEALVPSRAMLIARTEMARTENFGGVEGYRENDLVGQKGWMCSFVPASRQAHMDADGEEVPLDDDFTVGGEALAYPGDPKCGDPGNICNCLCTTYPVVGDIQ